VTRTAICARTAIIAAMMSAACGFLAPIVRATQPTRLFREFVCCRCRAIPHGLRPWEDDDSPPLVVAARVSWRRWWS
jgi:hypothetical protein